MSYENQVMEKELTHITTNNQIDVDAVIEQRGMLEAIRVVSEYLDKCKYPLMRGKERDEMVLKKLIKIRERYFEPIDIFR